MSKLTIVGVLAVGCCGAAAGPVAWESSELGQTAILPMKNAPYPHASRAEGFKIENQFFPRDPHYVDNSVALFIPKGYRPEKRTDLLVYFHGHLNNIRKALVDYYPSLAEVHLTDYKVRILDPERATAAKTRALLEATYGEEQWTTIGVSDNVIEASSTALADSIELHLARQRERKG